MNFKDDERNEREYENDFLDCSKWGSKVYEWASVFFSEFSSKKTLVGRYLHVLLNVFVDVYN